MPRYKRPNRPARDIEAIRSQKHDLPLVGNTIPIILLEQDFLYDIVMPHKGILHHFTFKVGEFNLKKAAVLLEVVDPLDSVKTGLSFPLRKDKTKGRKSLVVVRGAVLRVSIVDKEIMQNKNGSIEGFAFSCTLSVNRKDIADGNWANGRKTSGFDSTPSSGIVEG